MSHAASITLVGRVGTNPQLSSGATGDRVTFRVVATERRFDRLAQDWVDGDEFGVSVLCWRGLATSVLGVVRKGDPVVVTGRISTRRFADQQGVTQFFTEVKADTIGLDVGKVGNRIARKQPDGFGDGTRETGLEAPAGVPAPTAVEPDGGFAGVEPGAVDLPPEPELDDDPWGLPDTESGRSGELVGSG